MSGSLTYNKILPDYTDLDNNSGAKPGYKVSVLEKDGGVSVQLQNSDDKSDEKTLKAVFMNVTEANEFMAGIKNAIDRANQKNANHRNRAREIL